MRWGRLAIAATGSAALLACGIAVVTVFDARDAQRAADREQQRVETLARDLDRVLGEVEALEQRSNAGVTLSRNVAALTDRMLANSNDALHNSNRGLNDPPDRLIDVLDGSSGVDPASPAATELLGAIRRGVDDNDSLVDALGNDARTLEDLRMDSISDE